MREAILRDFFLSHAAAETLSADLNGAIVPAGPDEASVVIHDEVGEFSVTVAHLLRVCDAVLEGALEPWKLEAIGFCLVASDFFTYDRDTPDGEELVRVIHMWAAPQGGNYPLTLKNVAKFREYLATGVDPFTSADLLQRAEVEWKVGRVSKRFEGRDQ